VVSAIDVIKGKKELELVIWLVVIDRSELSITHKTIKRVKVFDRTSVAILINS
jgi:hypothetical protein